MYTFTFRPLQFSACNPAALLQSSNYSSLSVHISARSCVRVYSTAKGEMEHCACVCHLESNDARRTQEASFHCGYLILLQEQQTCFYNVL